MSKKIESLSLMDFSHFSVSKSQQLELYKKLLLPRLIEEKMLVLLRQGKISKWFSGIGQEAISVGVTSALKDSDYILPMHRNLGVFTSRQVPLFKLFCQWQGKLDGFTKGRDRSFHFGSQYFNLVGMISHLGPQMGVANGIALADLLKMNKGVTAVFSGEGGTSEGDFHEALNVASVWNLPVLFCIENNGYGLSTPTNEQYNCKNIADRALGYGMRSVILNGNNILEVYTEISKIAKELRLNPEPVLIEFKTFRMRGHEEASGTKYVPQELMDEWAAKDPLQNYQNYLLDHQLITKDDIEQMSSEIKSDIDGALQQAYAAPDIIPNEAIELADCYAPFQYEDFKAEGPSNEIRFIDAISDGLRQSMEKHEDLVFMGQDIAEYGGAFKISEGYLEQFGKARVRNTPICESGIVEAAMGLSIGGIKSVVELQFSDFVTSGFNPIVNYLAKVHYRWGQNADVVLRMPCGAGVAAGPFHSQTNEAWFTKTPGLKVVYPAFPYDAKGLLTTAVNDPNPVMFFEHKALYRSVKQEVPDGYYTIPFGEAVLRRTGDQVTIVAYGAAVHWAIATLNDMPFVSADLIDLNSLQPLDTETIYASVRKTGKAIVFHEDTMFGGIGADIASLIADNCFEFLDAPVKRVASIETPIPFNPLLEKQFLPQERFGKTLTSILSY